MGLREGISKGNGFIFEFFRLPDLSFSFEFNFQEKWLNVFKDVSQRKINHPYISAYSISLTRYEINKLQPTRQSCFVSQKTHWDEGGGVNSDTSEFSGRELGDEN